ncbi:MAG: gamma-glutamylcyclotransferase [Archangiaceae bacterium]|nr:gamma-glutamylcyclotransferase [Archangiaceae bacterium]
MDSHYDQVMKQRASAGQGVKRYFAYSTILDRTAFLEWRSQHGYDFFDLPLGKLAEALDVAVVFDFPSRFWGGRVAGLKDSKGEAVFGRLFEISEKDWAVIQHKEGAVTGMSVEKPVKVKLEGGEVVDAIAFATNPVRASTDGAVSPNFVQALTRGAKSAGLPDAWVQKLSASASG